MSNFTRKRKATRDVEEFLAGTAPRQEISNDIKSNNTILPGSGPFPWNAPGIRDDVFKVYNLRLPEAYLLKLKYIAEHTPHSMQRFCLESLLPAIDAKIEELTKG
jgi:hypothetical protein